MATLQELLDQFRGVRAPGINDPLFTRAQTKGIGFGSQAAHSSAVDDATQQTVNLAYYGIPDTLGMFGESAAPHPFAATSGISRFGDPNNIIQGGPHQGRGAFTELIGNYAPILQSSGPAGQQIVSLAQRFMSEQDAQAHQDEGSTSYGEVANAQQYANQIAELVRSLPPTASQQIDQVMALPSEERSSFIAGLAQSGQTLGQQDVQLQIAQQLVATMVQEGMDQKDVVKTQQALLGARGEDLTKITSTFATWAKGVQDGLIQPEQVRSIGQSLGQNVDQLLAEGKDLSTEFAGRLGTINQQITQQIPAIQKYSNDMGALGSELDQYNQAAKGQIPAIQSYSDRMNQLGQGLGKFDQQRFDERFLPPLMQLRRQYDINRQSVIDSMNERGINPGSENERYQNLLLTRNMDEDTKNAMLQAQAQAEGQQLSEYGAQTTSGVGAATAPLSSILQSGQQATGAYQARSTAGLAAARSPLEALQQALASTTGEADARLRIYAAKGDVVNQKANQYNLAQQELAQSAQTGAAGVDAANNAYQARTAEMNQANQRFNDTFGVAMGQTAIPASDRTQIGANVATSDLSSRLGYQANQNRTATERTMISRQMPFNILGAAIGAGGQVGGGLAIASSKEFKENIKELPSKTGEEALDALNSYQVKRWNYKGDPETHLGGITEEMPEELLTPDKKAVKLHDEMALMMEAVKALDKRTRGYGKGLESLRSLKGGA